MALYIMSMQIFHVGPFSIILFYYANKMGPIFFTYCLYSVAFNCNKFLLVLKGEWQSDKYVGFAV